MKIKKIKKIVSKKIKTMNIYEKIKHEEIIGPFHFGKELREAQKRFYKNQNKMNKNKFINRSNTAKK
jgi:predicted RNA-binding protein